MGEEARKPHFGYQGHSRVHFPAQAPLRSAQTTPTLLNRVPVIMIDVKGDLPNLLLSFPHLSAQEFAPWLSESTLRRTGKDRLEYAGELAEQWKNGLARWSMGAQDVAEFQQAVAPRVFTPGTQAGEPLHVLSSLSVPSPLWQSDIEVTREALSASISLLLRLIGRDPDPTRSRDHVVLSILSERRLRSGDTAGVEALLTDVRVPPITTVGAMPIDEFLPEKDRTALATALNTLLASPTFESWRTGSPLRVADWVTPRADGKTPATIISVAHLDEDERQLVLGIVLEQLLSWVRTQAGTPHLRALLVFDEVFGFVPPHPKDPPSKAPLLSLMKQARLLAPV